MALNMQISTPTTRDAEELAAKMRSADIDEMEAVLGSDAPRAAALEGILARSSHSWVLHTDGQLVMMAGLVPTSTMLGGSEAQPWMLATPKLTEHPGAHMKLQIRYIRLMQGYYDRLANYVDARNTVAIQWLKRTGFNVRAETQPYGLNGLPFHFFDTSPR